MSPILKPLWAIYYWLIFVPIFIVATILTALLTIITSIFDRRPTSHYPFARIWSRLTMILLFSPVHVEGREHLTDRAVLVAPNHLSALDVFVMAGYYPRDCSWMLKSSLRKIPFVGYACERVGFIYVDRTPTGARRVIRDAEERIAAGGSILMFPEGTRSTTGRLGRLRKGAASIALSTGTPIQPVAIHGTFEALPKGHYFAFPHRITMTILPLIDVEGYEEGPRGIVALTADVTEALSKGLEEKSN